MLRRELVVGMALMVERWYEGSQFLSSLWEKEACAPHNRRQLSDSPAQ